MNLKEFVKKAITEIVEAVEESSGASKRRIELQHTSGDNLRTIEFDVAVSAEKGTEIKGEAGIKVLTFAEGKGDLMKKQKSSTVSRIIFGVHVSALTKTEEARLEIEYSQKIQNSRNEYAII